ncbi:hypothetical protein PPERSA_09123 [Pseudocohnilembus persalinus]|uniref:Uncharacterized protein n=1 Tax=Pseudocohnilembus persalinus TaxID=266149 RepID=A0A0V0QX26_PSEPJ|nr:hypothetical protein PPERSA_09123 [Pseudocohnilembus persalinus]|eukprot:KRX06721.1 hypothetical protein PPERSA_09123 [Pseudocohnilembus persalinus]
MNFNNKINNDMQQKFLEDQQIHNMTFKKLNEALKNMEKQNENCLNYYNQHNQEVMGNSQFQQISNKLGQIDQQYISNKADYNNNNQVKEQFYEDENIQFLMKGNYILKNSPQYFKEYDLFMNQGIQTRSQNKDIQSIQCNKKNLIKSVSLSEDEDIFERYFKSESQNTSDHTVSQKIQEQHEINILKEKVQEKQPK